MHIITDNASCHRSKVTKDYLKSQNILFKYNLPYSPELNPIEMVFAKIKNGIRYKMINTHEDISKYLDSVTNNITSNEMSNYYKHSYC